MIEFFAENDFELQHKDEVSNWISGIISSEGFEEGDLTYIFCSDTYLHQINLEFLKHDTLTDIITFDYSLGKELHGEIYISTERVMENAKEFDQEFSTELHRVLAHGALHLCGYKDKTDKDLKGMRKKEDEYLTQRSFI